MIQPFHCSNCHKKLFEGSLKMILSRQPNPANSIEVKCDRCGKLNTFVYESNREIVKTDTTSSLFDL